MMSNREREERQVEAVKEKVVSPAEETASADSAA
jgi:hypothetical protein